MAGKLPKTPKNSEKRALPLGGVRVLDLSRVLAGPFATQILGDLGADVIKIESPKGDETRQWGPPYWHETSAYFLSANRNKRSFTADLKNENDREAILALLKSADVLIENFKVDSLKKFGLDFESLRLRFPKLIYCSITGFGQTGPLAHHAGYDLMIQAMSGLMSITGADASHPTKVGVAVSDLTTGLYAVIAILAALRERENSGLGQRCDLGLYDCQISLLSNVAMNFLTSRKVPEPRGNQHPSIVPYLGLKTRDGRMLTIAVGNDAQFADLCAALETNWSSDARYAGNPKRVENRDSLVGLLEKKILERDLKDWIKIFEKHHFPYGPVAKLDEVEAHAQTKAREIFRTLDDAKTPTISSPLRFSRTPIGKYSVVKSPEKIADATWK